MKLDLLFLTLPALLPNSPSVGALTSASLRELPGGRSRNDGDRGEQLKLDSGGGESKSRLPPRTLSEGPGADKMATDPSDLRAEDSQRAMNELPHANLGEKDAIRQEAKRRAIARMNSELVFFDLDNNESTPYVREYLEEHLTSRVEKAVEDAYERISATTTPQEITALVDQLMEESYDWMRQSIVNLVQTMSDHHLRSQLEASDAKEDLSLVNILHSSILSLRAGGAKHEESLDALLNFMMDFSFAYQGLLKEDSLTLSQDVACSLLTNHEYMAFGLEMMGAE